MGYPMRVLSRIMTYAEFLEWCRIFAEEPFDDRRCFDRPAAAIQTTACLISNPKTEITQNDFMPYFKKDEKDVDEIDVQVMRYL